MADSKYNTAFYPFTSQVNLPHVGGDDRFFFSEKIELPKIHSSQMTDVGTRRNKQKSNYLEWASTDIHFSLDVVIDRGRSSLPYSLGKHLDTFDYSDIVTPRPKICAPIGRHNKRGDDTRHRPCHPDMSSKPYKTATSKKKNSKLSPAKNHRRSPGVLKKDQNRTRKNEDEKNVSMGGSGYDDEVTLVDCKGSGNITRGRKGMKWDEYLMTRLDQNTAQWIVGQKMSPGQDQERLKNVLVDQYGPAISEELIPDDGSDSDTESISRLLSSKDANRSSYPQKSLASKKRTDIGIRGLDAPPQPDEKLLKSLYIKTGDIDDDVLEDIKDSMNKTAEQVQFESYTEKPPPTLRDYLNPSVGDKIFLTDNAYQQELLTGVNVVHHSFSDPSKLVLDSGNIYTVKRQNRYPVPLNKLSESSLCRSGGGNQPMTIARGWQRWEKLPQPLPDDYALLTLTNSDANYRGRPLSSMSSVPADEERALIVSEWLQGWHIGDLWYNSTIDDIYQSMSDINDHTRLNAVAACAKAATFRLEQKSTSRRVIASPSLDQCSSHLRVFNSEGTLPHKLLAGVERALTDPSYQVRFASAVTITALGQHNKQASDVLKQAISSSCPDERWTAAQCLALAGLSDSNIVAEFIHHLMDSTDIMKSSKASEYLIRLSHDSVIVYSMIAEQLNSSSWKTRVTACKIIPDLRGHINKDLTQKLCYLLWNDWSKEVRTAAAQTLGKTGHGKDVHDDLRKNIIVGNEREKVENLNKIGLLGIMTARLLPAYLQCFNDPYISVRKEACHTAGLLVIRDVQVQSALLTLTQYDLSWKVKAYAIKALASIGLLTDEISTVILWALRFEDNAGVRAQSCRAIVDLKMSGVDVTHSLQERLLVEPDGVVRREVIIALESLGVSPTGDMEMVSQVKREVQRLCSRTNIASKIVADDMKLERECTHNSLLYTTQNNDNKQVVDGCEVETTSESANKPRSAQTSTHSSAYPSTRASSSHIKSLSLESTSSTPYPEDSDSELPPTPHTTTDLDSQSKMTTNNSPTQLLSDIESRLSSLQRALTGNDDTADQVHDGSESVHDGSESVHDGSTVGLSPTQADKSSPNPNPTTPQPEHFPNKKEQRPESCPGIMEETEINNNKDDNIITDSNNVIDVGNSCTLSPLEQPENAGGNITELLPPAYSPSISIDLLNTLNVDETSSSSSDN